MEVGQRVGGYRLIERRGVGGAGTVWLAIDDGGVPVALKLLHPALAADERARARLVREARTVNAVRGGGVAHVVDVEVDDVQPFIVSEFVEGPTLAEVLRDGPLSHGEALRCATQLRDIVANVHTAGVIHRDIKPGNIIMSSTGPVLIDFGIAQGNDDEALTAHGFVSGTASYASPEILRGARADEASDWWAWAATVLHLVTGRPPFGTGPTEAVMNRVLTGAPDTTGLPGPVARIFRTALHPDTAQRLTAWETIDLLSVPDAWQAVTEQDTQATTVLPHMGGIRPVVAPSFTPSMRTTTPEHPDMPVDAVPYAGLGSDLGGLEQTKVVDAYGNEAPAYGRPLPPATTIPSIPGAPPVPFIPAGDMDALEHTRPLPSTPQHDPYTSAGGAGYSGAQGTYGARGAAGASYDLPLQNGTYTSGNTPYQPGNPAEGQSHWYPTGSEQPAGGFSLASPPSAPVITVAILGALALLPIFMGAAGVYWLGGVLFGVSILGGMSRDVRKRRLAALGVRRSDWWVALMRSPLTIVRVAATLSLGTIAGASIAATIAYFGAPYAPQWAANSIYIPISHVPQALMASQASPAITEITTNLYVALALYAVVVLALILMWAFPSGRDFAEGIALPVRALLHPVWARALMATMILTAIVTSWWLPVKSLVFWM